MLGTRTLAKRLKGKMSFGISAVRLDQPRANICRPGSGTIASTFTDDCLAQWVGMGGIAPPTLSRSGFRFFTYLFGVPLNGRHGLLKVTVRRAKSIDDSPNDVVACLRSISFGYVKSG